MPEYIDYAEYYDFDHDTKIDIDFYLNYAQQCGSPILELACGTGRILLPVAEQGCVIHGVDFSQNMLAICQQKVGAREITDLVSLTCANMAAFDLEEKNFALAYIPVRSFTHLFTQEDQLSCLRHTYNHLRAGGTFIVDVYAPHYKIMSQRPDGQFITQKEFELPNGNNVIRKDRFVRNDRATQIQYTELKFEETNPDGVTVREKIVPMDTRYTFRYELQLLLEKVGFEIKSVFRDYDKNPFNGTGEIIMVAQRPA